MAKPAETPDLMHLKPVKHECFPEKFLIAVAMDAKLLGILPRIHTVPIQRDDTSRSRFAPVFSSQPCEDPVQQFTSVGKPHGEVRSSGFIVQDAVQADMGNRGDLPVFGSAAPTQHPRF